MKPFMSGLMSKCIVGRLPLTVLTTEEKFIVQYLQTILYAKLYKLEEEVWTDFYLCHILEDLVVKSNTEYVARNSLQLKLRMLAPDTVKGLSSIIQKLLAKSLVWDLLPPKYKTEMYILARLQWLQELLNYKPVKLTWRSLLPKLWTGKV